MKIQGGHETLPPASDAYAHLPPFLLRHCISFVQIKYAVIF